MTIPAIGPHVVLDQPGFIHETARLHGKPMGPEASIGPMRSRDRS